MSGPGETERSAISHCVPGVYGADQVETRSVRRVRRWRSTVLYNPASESAGAHDGGLRFGGARGCGTCVP